MFEVPHCGDSPMLLVKPGWYVRPLREIMVANKDPDTLNALLYRWRFPADEGVRLHNTEKDAIAFLRGELTKLRDREERVIADLYRPIPNVTDDWALLKQWREEARAVIARIDRCLSILDTAEKQAG
jgi:hypothetical protein